MPKQYYIDFDTQDMPGCIIATRVIIERVIIRDDKMKMNIDLVDDPLYRNLQCYILGNPRVYAADMPKGKK